MEVEDTWQPDSDDSLDGHWQSWRGENSDSGLGGGLTLRNRINDLYKLVSLVHFTSYRSGFSQRVKIRDCADYPSSRLARGTHFQTRKLSGHNCLAKFPVISPADGAVDRLQEAIGSFEAAAFELQILLHGPLRQHRNIVDIQGVGWTRLLLDDLPCLPITLVEFAAHGTLAQYLSSNSVDPAVKNSLSLDVVHGLQALHSCGVTHGDVKLENVLVFPCTDRRYSIEAKLSDFGSSVLETESSARLRGFTPPWNAPEWYGNIEPRNMHKTDIYSLGLLIWHLTLDGRNPFEAMDPDQIEIRKASGAILEDAIQSVEREYNNRILLRDSLDDHSRFEIYRYNVAIPRRIFQYTLAVDPIKRSLKKPLISFIGLFGAPDYARSAFRQSIQNTARNETASDVERGEACLQLCWAMLDGFGAPQDVRAACSWAVRAARHGNVSAASILRLVHELSEVPMDPELREIWIKLLDVGVQDGSILARRELRRVDADRCRLAEVKFQTELGADLMSPNVISMGLDHDKLIDQLFHPRNRKSLLNAAPPGSSLFMSLQRNTYLHGGSAMGVDIQNFSSSLEDMYKDLNAVDKHGNTPLLVALRCNHPKHAQELLKHGANAAIKNNDRHTPCHWLIYIDDPHEQELLLSLMVTNGADLTAAADPSQISDCDPIRYAGTPLHWSVQMNMLALTKSLLAHGADAELAHGRLTPLDIAVFRNNAEILKALLVEVDTPLGAGMNVMNPSDESSVADGKEVSYVNIAVNTLLCHDRLLLHGQSWLDQLRQTILLLRDVDPASKASRDVIGSAALSPNVNVEILHLLVEAGFDGPSGKTAAFWQDLIHDVILECEPFVAIFFLENYQKYACLKDFAEPERLLWKAVRGLSCNEQVLDKILQMNVDIECLDPFGTPFVSAVHSRNYELATFLLCRGANPSAIYRQNAEQEEPAVNVFHDLIKSNMDICIEPLKYLLEPLHPHSDKVPDFMVVPERRVTVLHMACSIGNIAVVKYIIHKFPEKFQLDFVSMIGWTAVHYATFQGHLEVVKALCEAGADINAQIERRAASRSKRWTALDLCFFSTGLSKEELEHSYGHEKTRDEIYLGRLSIAQYLEEHGGRKARRKILARSPALKFAYLAVLQELPKLLMETVRRIKDGSLKQLLLDALLFQACRQASLPIVDILIQAGADVNARSKTNNTPLHVATIRKHPRTIHLLLKAGAEVNPINDFETTPLECALHVQIPASLHVLKKAGGLIAGKRAAMEKTLREQGFDPSKFDEMFPMMFGIRIAGEPDEFNRSGDDATDDSKIEDEEYDLDDFEHDQSRNEDTTTNRSMNSQDSDGNVLGEDDDDDDAHDGGDDDEWEDVWSDDEDFDAENCNIREKHHGSTNDANELDGRTE